MPPNFGILPELPVRIRNKQERYGVYRDRSLGELDAWISRFLTPTFAQV
jgi:methylenetetrahydrofolate--tRNA-(uracil-5-)-methyltransferase